MPRQRGAGRAQETVNVSCVRQLSPLRYPGGKTWMVPYIQSALSDAGYYRVVEPFAGGGIISLNAIDYELVEEAVLVEKDKGVAALWKTILRDNDWLVDNIVSFVPTRKNVEETVMSSDMDRRSLAFRTIIRNRFNYGGIIAKGASLLRYGEDKRGIASRWYPETIAGRIQNIKRVSGRFRIIQGDGLKEMEKYDSPNTLFFVDPPYTASGKRAGRRLYDHNAIDHDKLFDLVSELSGGVIMTYDYTDDMIHKARSCGLCIEKTSMRNRNHTSMTELIIKNR